VDLFIQGSVNNLVLDNGQATVLDDKPPEKKRSE